VGDVKFEAQKLQQDLITLGYLPKGSDDAKWGGGSKRALKRFKRRATTVYRVSSATNLPADCDEGEVSRETVNDVVTQVTLDEIKKWLNRKWKAPLGRYTFHAVGHGRLREDVASAWAALAPGIEHLGGTIEGPYGDTLRRIGKAKKAGQSSFSFHTVGRAVDLRQEFANRAGRRYYVVKEPNGPTMYWRIYCSTDKQDGSQGEKFAKGKVEWWDFADKKNIKIPEGYYMDLTAAIEDDGSFERIPAQAGWEGSYNKAEWWHFQWALDKQETFQDECELVGISEKDLKAAGYSEADMDRKPG